MKLVALGSLALFGFVLAACGGDSAATDDVTSESEGELRASGITSIYVSRGPGFRPPPPAGSCHPSGHWTVDFANATLRGDACVNGRATDIDRDLSSGELAEIRAKVSALRSVRRPTSCPTDLPVNSIEIQRGSSSLHYVDQRAACGGGVKAVKETGLAALVDLLESLSAPAPTSGAPAPAPWTSPCPPCEVGFNCNEATATCDPL